MQLHAFQCNSLHLVYLDTCAFWLDQKPVETCLIFGTLPSLRGSGLLDILTHEVYFERVFHWPPQAEVGVCGHAFQFGLEILSSQIVDHQCTDQRSAPTTPLAIDSWFNFLLSWRVIWGAPPAQLGRGSPWKWDINKSAVENKLNFTRKDSFLVEIIMKPVYYNCPECHIKQTFAFWDHFMFRTFPWYLPKVHALTKNLRAMQHFTCPSINLQSHFYRL